MQTIVEFLCLWIMFSAPLALVVARCIATGNRPTETAGFRAGWHEAR